MYSIKGNFLFNIIWSGFAFDLEGYPGSIVFRVVRVLVSRSRGVPASGGERQLAARGSELRGRRQLRRAAGQHLGSELSALRPDTSNTYHFTHNTLGG